MAELSQLRSAMGLFALVALTGCDAAPERSAEPPMPLSDAGREAGFALEPAIDEPEQSFSDGRFAIAVPKGWQRQADTPDGGVAFSAPDGRASMEVRVLAAGDPALLVKREREWLRDRREAGDEIRDYRVSGRTVRGTFVETRILHSGPRSFRIRFQHDARVLSAEADMVLASFKAI